MLSLCTKGQKGGIDRWHIQGGLTLGGETTTPGFSTQRYAQLDTNIGYGESAGISIQLPAGMGQETKGVTVQTGLPIGRIGIGVGAQASVGLSIQATYATAGFDAVRRLTSFVCGP